MSIRKTSSVALAAILVLGTFGISQNSANAQSVLYPRVIESGENKELDYGPAGNANAAFGGGQFEVVGRNSEGQAELRYLDAQYAQPARSGLLPVTVGGGEGSTTVWVPAGTDRSVTALIGADGSLPGFSRQIAGAGSLLASAR